MSSVNNSSGKSRVDAESVGYYCLGCGCPVEAERVQVGYPFHNKDCWRAFNAGYGKDISCFFENLICKVFLVENVGRSTQELRVIAVKGIKEIRRLTASGFPKSAMLAAVHAQFVNGYILTKPRGGRSVHAQVKYPYLFNPYVPSEDEEEAMLRERAWKNQWIFKIYKDSIEHFSMGGMRCEYLFNLGDEINVSTDTLWRKLCEDPVYSDKIFTAPFDSGYF